MLVVTFDELNTECTFTDFKLVQKTITLINECCSSLNADLRIINNNFKFVIQRLFFLYFNSILSTYFILCDKW